MRCSCGSAGSGKGVCGLPGASASELWAAAQAGAVRRVLIGQAVRYFDGAPYQGLPLGEVGIHGAVSREQALVVNEEQLEQAYEDERPPWFQDEPTFGPDYTQSFMEVTPEGLGYERVKGEEVRADGWWSTPSRTRYDERGVPVGMLDPLGNETTVTLDETQLLPVAVTVPGGMTTRAEYDYRLLQPKLLEDPNGNRSEVRYTPLGLVDRLVRRGKVDEEVGDTWEKPSAEFTYELLAWERDRLPTWVHATRRVWHALSPEGDNDDVVETREYSDGCGRVIQARRQAADVLFPNQTLSLEQGDRGSPVEGVVRTPGADRRVVVSGWQRYDNKGRVVMQWEPQFGSGWDYTGKDESGARVTTYYDPLGRVQRVVAPDGSESLTVFGEPIDLGEPSKYRPSPWVRYVYDANDNAQRTPAVPGASAVPLTTTNTPGSIEVDALGRTVRAISRNGPTQGVDEGTKEANEFVTTMTYDIRGNVLVTTDPMGREAFKYVYDLANTPLRTESIDAGVNTMVLDAAGNSVESRDAKGALLLRSFDHLQRPVAMWARDSGPGPITLRERIQYGDQAPAEVNAWEMNLLGVPWRSWDEAGLVETERIDFAGNALSTSRRVINNERLMTSGWVVDWTSDEGVLEERRFESSARYDALGRVVEQTTPLTATGAPGVVRTRYDAAGAVEHVTLDGNVVVEHTAYDAKGQRTLVAWGNGVMQRWAWDPKTFRLVRTRAERYRRDGWAFTPQGAPFRDTLYEYDLVGNVVAQHERSPGCGPAGTPDVLDRLFTYDAVYRLTSGTGRESDTAPATLWSPAPRGRDVTKSRLYREEYAFDKSGNLTSLVHTSDAGRWRRTLTPQADNNRLATLASGDSETPYAWDGAGNMTAEGYSRRMSWDHANRMVGFRTEGGEEASVDARYIYDHLGQRVKKLVRKGGGWVSTTYFGDFEVHEDGAQRFDELRIAGIRQRFGSPFDGDAFPETTLTLADQVQSSVVTIGGDGAWLRAEDYTPWGETSFGGYSAKRYRFNGKERDKESGFAYYGLRYAAPWLGRWTCADPLGPVDSLNLFIFTRNAPVGLIDPLGGETTVSEYDNLSNATEGHVLTATQEHAEEEKAREEVRQRYGPEPSPGLLYEAKTRASEALGGAWDWAKLHWNAFWAAESVAEQALAGVVTDRVVDASRAFDPTTARHSYLSSDNAQDLADAENRRAKEKPVLREAAAKAGGVMVDASGVLLAARKRIVTKTLVRPSNGRVIFNGLEVRGMRDLSHVPESTLRAQAKLGFASKDAKGRALILHHHRQNPAGPIVEMPAVNHSIGNVRQHPFGNAAGSGLSPDQRAEFDVWRVEYWKARATGELTRRGLQ